MEWQDGEWGSGGVGNWSSGIGGVGEWEDGGGGEGCVWPHIAIVASDRTVYDMLSDNMPLWPSFFPESGSEGFYFSG